MDETVKMQLINFLSNMSILRMTRDYKMSEEEYIFYTKGMVALSFEMDLMALLTEDLLNRIKRMQHERDNYGNDQPREDS
jgi:hypothetical protein